MAFNKIPAMAANADPMANVREIVRFTLIPISAAAPLSSDTALIALPAFVLLINQVNATIVIPVITNVTAEYVENKDVVKELLKKQVSNSVKWEESVRKMISDGVDTFVEVGPGKTLSGFIKKIDKEIAVYNVEDIASLDKTLEALK